MKPGEQLTVEFYLKPGMEDYEWLQHILKFVKIFIPIPKRTKMRKILGQKVLVEVDKSE